jgi:diguanylate cyclase (GGDEF)-like protein
MFLSLPPQPDHSWKNMNPMDHEILLETIVAITEQRDQHSLELSLLASLNEMLQPTVCFLLDLPSGASDRQRKTASGASMELPEEIVELAGTIPEYQFVKAHSGDLIYLLTVIVSGKDEQRRVLFVGMPGWNETAERLLVGMVRVYQNFMKLMSESEIDTLTGLQNRRKLESFLTSRLSARLHQRRESDMQIGSSSTLEKGEYLAVLDLDRFKRINDTFGHLIGDEVLLTFSSILRASLRDNDRSFRYGGEEFIVVLTDVSREQAASVLERLRSTVEKHDFPQVGSVTVSIGYTRIAEQDLPTRIIEEADKALYYAKEHGRNQLREYQTLLKQGEVEDTHQHDGSIELF